MIDHWETEILSEGFVVIPDVIPTNKCQDIRERLLAVAKQHRRAQAYSLAHVSYVPGLLGFDHSWANHIADDRVLAVVERLLGKNLRVSFTSLQTNEPDKPRSEWHADWPFNQRRACHLPAPYPDVVMHLTSLWMVSSFTKENGGTLVVSRSHRQSTNPTDPRLGVDPAAPHPQEFQVIGDAGGMLLFDSRTWHCAPANLSGQPRVSVSVRYAP